METSYVTSVTSTSLMKVTIITGPTINIVASSVDCLVGLVYRLHLLYLAYCLISRWSIDLTRHQEKLN